MQRHLKVEIQIGRWRRRLVVGEILFDSKERKPDRLMLDLAALLHRTANNLEQEYGSGQ